MFQNFLLIRIETLLIMILYWSRNFNVLILFFFKYKFLINITTNRFVGMLPQNQLQDFLVRVITGFGDRVQNDISEADLLDISAKLANLAGLSSMTFQKREKLFKLLDEAMDMEGAWQMDVKGSTKKTYKFSDAVKTSLLYLQKAATDIRNPKFRSINASSKVFLEKILVSPAALKILSIAGFRPTTGTSNNTTASISPASTGEEDSKDKSAEAWVLQHYNVAILNLVVQVVSVG